MGGVEGFRGCVWLSLLLFPFIALLCVLCDYLSAGFLADVVGFLLLLFPFIALLCVLCAYLSAGFLADVVGFLLLLFPFIALLCLYVFRSSFLHIERTCVRSYI